MGLFDISPLPPLTRTPADHLALIWLAVLMLTALSCQGAQPALPAAPPNAPPATASLEAKLSKKGVGLLLFDSTAAQDSDPTFEKVLLYYGLTVVKLDLSRESLTASQLVDEAGGYYPAIAINHQTLEKAGLLSDAGVQALRDAVGSGTNLLVSGISPSPEGGGSPGLAALTGNEVRGAESRLDSSRDWKVEGSLPDATLELTGLEVSYSQERQEDFALLIQEVSTGVASLITSSDDQGNRYTVFARQSQGQGSIFLDADYAGNLDRSRMWDLLNSRYFGRLVPTMMFARYAFGEMAWHSNNRYANLTLDDPSLTEPWYSFSYRQLLLHMNSADFHTSIAMPPMSYQEPQKEVIDIFLRNPERYSVVVHGNNHDSYEFYYYDTKPGDQYAARPLGVQDANLVQALTRMEEFKRAMGIPYGRVMVFPYNISPLPTILLMKKYNFLATANAANVPLGETMKSAYDFNAYPAVMDYGSFPLLTRYEPDSLPYPMLFFVGKPVLPFAHIDLFRDNPGAFDSTAQAINRSWGKTKVQWRSLDYIMKHLYLEKRNEDGTTGIKFFGNDLVLANESGQAQKYILWKTENLEVPIEKITVDGRSVPYAVKDGLLRLDLEIGPNSTSEILISFGGGSLPDFTPTSVSYEKLNGLLKVDVENRGNAEGPVPIALYDGDDSRPVQIIAMKPLSAGAKATAAIDLSKLLVKGSFTVKLNPFAVVQESAMDNNEASLEAPEAATVVLDNFEYNDSPLNHGWSIQEGSGSANVVYDRTSLSQVLNLASLQGLNFKVNYPLPGRNLSIPRGLLRLRFMTTQDFEIFVRVTGTDGNGYYIKYTSQNGDPSIYNEYLTYPLGVSVKDGKWHILQRDLLTDMRGVFKSVEYLVIRGSLQLDDLTLSTAVKRSSSG
ncbi:MAG: hypothetical protein Q7R39_01975 [Dehalococcoidia bacterium]|nr:hypothetical protein [Dehalococcoidia bacterium]